MGKGNPEMNAPSFQADDLGLGAFSYMKNTTERILSGCSREGNHLLIPLPEASKGGRISASYCPLMENGNHAAESNADHCRQQGSKERIP
jgi:hypothetical protein